jgi:hypothetical protein
MQIISTIDVLSWSGTKKRKDTDNFLVTVDDAPASEVQW